MLRKDGPRGPWLDYIELIERLSTFPEADALNLLRRLRESNDLCAVLSSASGGARDKTRSTTLATNQLLISPVFTKLESELGSLHPIAYPWLSSIDIRTICREARNRFEARAWIMAAKGDSTSSDTESSGSPSLLCDSRLYHLRMDYWTRVPISDELAARVISSYLVREHPMLGLFDAELFVTDLVERRIRFCTPFLLSALMFYACHLYAPIDPGTLAIANSFLSEAETLWISERASDSITTLAGAQLLRITTLLQSSDQQSVAYSHEGRLMAGRMKLFGVAHSADNASHFATLTTKWQRATAHTAWGVYNCFAALGIFQLEYDAIPYTPILPIPGEHATEEFQRFGVTWPAHPLPNYVGHTFGPLCKLWTMVQEVSVVYGVTSGTTVADRIPLSFAESKYLKMLAWSDTLPSTFAYGRQSSANNLLFHMYFHGAVLNVFRPFQRRPHEYSMRSFASPDSFPTAAFAASLNQLKRLVVLTHLHHPPIDRSPFLAAMLVHLFCGLLKNAGDAEWKDYFDLCLVLGSQLFTWYRVLGQILQGTLAMGLRDGVLTGTEAQDLLRKYVSAGRHKVMEDIPKEGAFILDLDLAMTAPVDAMAQSLARRFDDLVLFSEFAHVNHHPGP
ncbi:DnaJ like subfamily A member 5 [Apiospora arundinis]